MSRKRSRAEVAATPQYVTVKAAGPIDPWRLPAVVIGVALTSGAPLLEATRTGDRLDEMLLRAFVVGLVTWILLGVINRMLVQASVLRAVERTRLELAGPDRSPQSDPRSAAPGDPTR